ncbi:hypothetical protein BH09ACT4_BH09ACT4_12510 [soil metagenome]
MRAAHRQIIAPHLEPISEDVHEIVAGIVVMRKRTVQDSDATEWQKRSKDAGLRLDATRRKVQYTFPDLNGAFRELSRASDHVATYKNLPGTNVDRLVKAYQQLANRVNKSVASSYRRGVPASSLQQFLLWADAKWVRHLWDKRPTKP